MHTLHTRKGITLIETIVAVTILVAAITGPMTLAASSLRATRDARNELIATHLAEEGVEVLHNIRDNNVTNFPVNPQTSWLTNLLMNCRFDGCAIDITQQDPSSVWSPLAAIPCPPMGCPGLSTVYFNPNTGLYRQSQLPLSSPWVVSPFKRVLTVTGVNDPSMEWRQAHILVVVSYLGYGGVTKNVTINDDLYNWFPPLH